MSGLPADLVTSHRPTPYGVMRSRSVGRAVDGVPDLVVVPGIGVSEYLLPAVAELGRWTRAHLVELPGYSGSGEPPHELDVDEFADALLDWLATTAPGRTILVGHSGGTQVVARAAAHHPAGLSGVVLASPGIDPAFRSLGGVLR